VRRDQEPALFKDPKTQTCLELEERKAMGFKLGIRWPGILNHPNLDLQ
jgi:hypothetical protein